MGNILDFACAELDRKAGRGGQSERLAMRIAMETIAASNLPAAGRMALICDLELRWRDAGLS